MALVNHLILQTSHLPLQGGEGDVAGLRGGGREGVRAEGEELDGAAGGGDLPGAAAAGVPPRAGGRPLPPLPHLLPPARAAVVRAAHRGKSATKNINQFIREDANVPHLVNCFVVHP